PGATLERARALVAQLDDGSGVLVLTDMYGATPGNIAGSLLADGRVEGVAGLSLPMLVRVLSGDDRTLAAAVQRALSGGAEGVLHMNRDCCRDAQR
ncbi:MAG TPA: PTS fructose transporter subunit IIA, partial [Burkholderiales bacterium]|nr:PTS fructose transporter subunit IIA [Burkholderiales bacterium]